MSNVTDLMFEILKGIRSDLTELQSEMRNGFASLNQRIDGVSSSLGARIDGLSARIDGENERIDTVIRIVGNLHTNLERRVTRIEDHLGLPRE